ncbi:MAG: DUF4317 domain-containing protein [Lachnospiraceae bacterium]|nr:DUF4317 domain-containing protein [Lachnospiraceae bacterium]
MYNSDVLEIRKRFKKEKTTIGRITGCYVTGADKQIKTYIDTDFVDLEEAEQFKYIEILKKGLSGVLNKNLLSLRFKEEALEAGGAQQSLLALRNSELKNKEMLEAFYQQIIDTYYYVGNYLILLIHDTYDVMTKTEDKMALDESEEVYSYVLCCICPVNLSKPGLSYHEEENVIANRDRDWVVDMPDAAFLYPAFCERSTDVNEVLYYVKNIEEMHSEFIDNVLGCIETVPSTVEKEIFHQIVEEVINDAPGYDTFEVVRSINTQLNDMAENMVFGEPKTIQKDDMVDLMVKSGLKEEHIPIVEEKFEKAIGEDVKLHLDNVREKKNFEVKTDEMQIKVKSEAADIVEIRVIDGRKCLVIPMNSDIEVNGIMKRIVQELNDSEEDEA